MTQQLNRASSAPIEEALPPPHPHYTLATLGVLGVVAALLALALGVGAIAITAGRDSVDDGIVSEKVDAFLADAGVAADAPTGERSAVVGDVLPAIVPKGELGPIADGEVNVAIAPEMPPPSGRTTPAVVEVHFEVVENAPPCNHAALTDREREPVRLGAHGLSNDEIADELFISPLTAKTHISPAMVKLGMRDRVQLVILAYETGLASVGERPRDRSRD